MIDDSCCLALYAISFSGANITFTKPKIAYTFLLFFIYSAEKMSQEHAVYIKGKSKVTPKLNYIMSS
jgi:hypothetical protein